LGGGKIFDFTRKTLFSLEKRLSKHKMANFSKNLGWHCLFSPPGYAFAIPKGDDLVLAGDFNFQSRESPKSCRALQTYNSPGD